jgi:hypothetical protein
MKRSKKKNKEEYNLRMKEYRDSNKLMNSYHCHNYKRRSAGYETISIEEFLEYRKFCSLDISGRLKSSRRSRVKEWEQKKVSEGIVFSGPKLKGNFTFKIKKRIAEEF